MADFLIILLLIGFNGFFSMAEIAIISSRKNHLKALGSKTAYELSQNPNIFLSTVQIGITLISILTGAIGDGRIVQSVTTVLNQVPIISSISQQLAFVLVIGLITYLTVVLGELVPKRLALAKTDQIVTFSAPVMLVLSRITSPVVKFLSFSTELILQVFGLKLSQNQPITEEEVRVLINEGTSEGIFKKTEKKIIEQVLEMDDLQVKFLMTPKHKIQTLDLDEFIKNPKKFLKNYTHSRIIFTRGDEDNIVGVLHVKSLIINYMDGCLFKIKDLEKTMSKPLLIPESTRVLKVLQMFRHSPVHIALVLDEFGSIQGLVTLNDVLESLVGAIKSQTYNDPQIVNRNDGSFLMDGAVSIFDLKKTLKLKNVSKDPNVYQTLGGLVIAYLDRIPKTGDSFIWENFKFEVVDMDENRVDKVLISRL